MNTQKTSREDELAAVIGLDWAKKEHVCCLLHGEAPARYERVKNEPGQLRQWALRLQERFGGKAVGICMEDSCARVVETLEEYSHIRLYLVNPATAAKYRKMFTPSGDKSDERDGASLADLLLKHREKAREHRPPDPKVRELDLLNRERRRAVDERTRHAARMHELLQRAYPVAAAMLENDLTSSMALALLKRWPSQRQLLKARQSTVLQFLHQHNCRSSKLNAERLETLARARELSHPACPSQALEWAIAQEVAMIDRLNESIATFDKAISEAMKDFSSAQLFRSFPGSGKCMAPRLLVEFHIREPHGAPQLSTATGVAPIRVQSGNMHRTFMRRYCSKFRRQSLIEFAGSSIQFSPWAKAYYQYQTKVMKKRSQCVKRSLALKWIRILYACWKNNTCYDEQLYLRSLAKSNSPILQFLNSPQNP